jgi:hypothetical protein
VEFDDERQAAPARQEDGRTAEDGREG